MKARDAQPGQVVEILENNLPTGRLYTILPTDDIIGDVTAHDHKTGIKVNIHPDCDVRPH